MGVPSEISIVNMGFTYQMFGYQSESDLNQTIRDLLSEHGDLLAGRIGATAYASTAQPTATYVSRALRFFVAAELCQHRINKLTQEVKEDDGKDALKLRRQKTDYLNEAESLISKIEATAGASNDFAVGTVVTSHFAEDA